MPLGVPANHNSVVETLGGFPLRRTNRGRTKRMAITNTVTNTITETLEMGP